MFALLDANNFYVSCERRFNKTLEGKAVIVLSNNDGCAIARSDEAKALGIKMGEPYFQIRERFPHNEVISLSANFTLYGDMSARLMGEAEALGHRQEIYSVDECFLDLSGIRGDLIRRGQIIRLRLQKRLGLPCGVGIGSTKTLAKLASHVAKSAARKPGSYSADFANVCNLSALSESDLEAVMQATPVGDVWGIGRRIAAQLEALGIKTVLDAVRLDATTVRQRWSVVLERTIRELQGQSCIELTNEFTPKKEIASTRSFGRTISTLPPMEQAVTNYIARAAQKLRQQNGLASQVHVFCNTSPHSPKSAQLYSSITIPLLRPTDSDLQLTKAALSGLRSIYKTGYNYTKAGVILIDILDKREPQQVCLGFHEEKPKSTALMGVLDAINDRYGRGTLRLASAGTQSQHRVWEMKQERKSPQYTTNWKQIVIARA